jgi:hypothetical protein
MPPGFLFQYSRFVSAGSFYRKVIASRDQTFFQDQRRSWQVSAIMQQPPKHLEPIEPDRAYGLTYSGP